MDAKHLLEDEVPSGMNNRSNVDPKSENESSSEAPEVKSEQNSRFHVNRELIPVAQLSENLVSEELKGLGLDVFNQDDFEQGVMAQVDEAMAKEEEERKRKQLEKEDMDIKYDIAKVKKEIETLSKVINSLGNAASTSSHVKARLSSVEKQRENKLSQLKTLLARQKAVQKKLNGSVEDTNSQEDDSGQELADLNHLLGLGGSKESEKERMIRLGQMTPFGTIIKTETIENIETATGYENTEDTAVQGPSSANLEESSTDSQDSTKEPGSSKHHKSHKSKKKDLVSSSSSREESRKKENFFDARDKKHYRNDVEGSYNGDSYRSRRKYKISHNFTEDSPMSDEEACYQDDPDGYLSDEYRPTEKELQEVSSDSGLSEVDETSDNLEPKEKKSKKRKLSLRPKKPPKFVTSDDEGDLSGLPLKRKVSREASVRTKDDGDDDLYEMRMSDFNDAEILRDKQIATGEIVDPEDKTFDGGLTVPGRIWSKLFDYQKVGVSWLWELHCQQAGGIIGDEMGLGKTIQMIAFMAALRQSKLRARDFRYKGIGPSLIICPTTVMQQWVREFHKWWPMFRVAILHSSGSATCSEDELVRKIVKCNGVLVTSYTTLVLHQDAVLPYNWHYVVLDEGHKIRNPDAQATLVCKQFKTPHRIILSGSPIQNNLKELWSLFDFIFPGKLGTLPDFLAHFSVPIVQGGYANATEIQVQTAYKCACVLRDTINPYLLRRMKADVKINLPSKNEQVLFCRLTDEQREVYMEYLQSRECQAILQGKFQIFAGLITLRKICNHADICTGGPKLYIGEDTHGDPTLEFGYWRRAGKMIVVEALLKLWKKQGHRVLLFSQSRAMLDILEKFVLDESYTYLRMDGGTPISTRQPLINTFNKDPSIFVFLLTTRVGGLGVNLTGANKVIIYDPDWNPSTDTQARERTWRIGQTKQVTIYRLLTSGTIEEKIYHRQIFKQFLTNRVLKDPKQRRFFKSNDLYELFDLGSKDDKEGTETSAIFAGTGSEVRKSEVKKRVNRFDLMRDKQKEEEKPPSDEEGSKFFEEDEIKRMRELARKLSEKIMHGKQGKIDDKGPTSESERLKHGETSKVKSKGERFLDSNTINIERNARLDVSAESKVRTENKDSCQNCEKERNHSGDKGHRSSKKSHSDRHGKHSKERRDSHSEKERRKKHKKRKHKDAEFEGEKVSHLVKQDEYKPQNNTEEKDDHTKEDDYVLHRLFKKTGMECAMKHDVIMDPNKHDYMIIESEAERIAKDAAKALKRSRSNCHDAKSGIPTWTGQSGAKRPRFGNKKNSLLVDKTKKAEPILAQSTSASTSTSSSTPSTSTSSQQHFDGSLAGNVVKNLQTGVRAENVMSSDQLILQMKKRNEVVAKPPGNDDEEDEDENEEDTSVPVIDSDSFQLISEIKNFILFGCSTIGKASTREILGEFGPKLPPTDSPKFKAMLHKICDFEKVNGSGFWKLKSEFKY